jgi:hypothetical protein
MVRNLWEEEYQLLPVPSIADEEPPYKRLKVMSALERQRAQRTSSMAGNSSSSQSALSGGHDEYDRWLSNPDAKNDPLVTNPFQYWWERRKDYPRLSRIALDLLSTPPMSAECERLFSVAGQNGLAATDSIGSQYYRGYTDIKVVGAKWPNKRRGYVN